MANVDLESPESFEKTTVYYFRTSSFIKSAFNVFLAGFHKRRQDTRNSPVLCGTSALEGQIRNYLRAEIWVIHEGGELADDHEQEILALRAKVVQLMLENDFLNEGSNGVTGHKEGKGEQR